MTKHHIIPRATFRYIGVNPLKRQFLGEDKNIMNLCSKCHEEIEKNYIAIRKKIHFIDLEWKIFKIQILFKVIKITSFILRQIFFLHGNEKLISIEKKIRKKVTKKMGNLQAKFYYKQYRVLYERYKDDNRYFHKIMENFLKKKGVKIDV